MGRKDWKTIVFEEQAKGRERQEAFRTISDQLAAAQTLRDVELLFARPPQRGSTLWTLFGNLDWLIHHHGVPAGASASELEAYWELLLRLESNEGLNEKFQKLKGDLGKKLGH